MDDVASAVDLDAARTRFTTLQAQFALKGFQLERRTRGGYRVSQFGIDRLFDSLEEVSAFGIRAGVIRMAPVEA